MAQQITARALQDKDYLDKSRQLTAQYRESLISGLIQVMPKIKIYPSNTNFILIRVSDAQLDAKKIAEYLFARGILVRTTKDFIGLDPAQYVRLAVRPPNEANRLIEALAQIMQETIR
jgi:histidinol-phosphate/aromatic aminotransferase/cobyric acid decarboxylase-like protein